MTSSWSSKEPRGRAYRLVAKVESQLGQGRLTVLDSFGLQDGEVRRVLPNLTAGTAVFKFERA